MARSVKVGGRKLSEFNDIVKQIDQDLHPDLIPSKTAAGSGKRVNWKCPDCNHKWNTKIADRTGYQTGCPKCSYSERADKKARVDEKQSIKALNPELSALWYQEKNGDVKPNIYKKFKLQEASKAHQILQSRKSLGSIILKP